LVFVVGPDGRAAQCLAQIGGLLSDRRTVLWHRVDRDGADLGSTLATAQDPACSVLLAHGLELVEGKARSVLARTLNLRRDALSPYKSIVAFWIARDFLRDFRRLCSDFFHWRSLLVTLTDEELDADVVTRWRYVDEAASWLKRMIQDTDPGGETLVQVSGKPALFSLPDWAGRTSRGRLASSQGIRRTVAMQSFAVALMRRARNDILEPLPIWIPLQELEMPTTVEDIAVILGACPGRGQLSPAVLKRWIRHGDLYFLLDGFDELSPDRRTSWQEWIEYQRIRHPGNRFLVTIPADEELLKDWDRATVIPLRRAAHKMPKHDQGPRPSLSFESKSQGIIQTTQGSHSSQPAVSLSSLLENLDPRRNGDSQNRALRARLLGRWGDPRAVSALIRSLDPEFEPAGHVRVNAALALGRMDDRRVVDALTRSLDPKFEVDDTVRGKAAEGLGTTTAEAPLVPTPATFGVPSRSARVGIHGFLYQTYIGILRWLDLGDDEVLVIEGDEDLDRLFDHGSIAGVSERVKAYHGRLGVRDQTVRDSLRAFAVAYAALRRRGDDRRFIFSASAEKRRPARGALDVFAVWDDPEQRDEVIAELRELLPKEDDKHITDALAWLEAEPGRWTEFVDAVGWKFEEPGLDGIRGQIDGALRGRGLRPTATHVDRLVAELFRASSQAEVDDRCRTSADLDDLLRSMDEELVRWSATPRAAALRELFDEVAEIGRVLHDGTRELRENPSPGHLLTAAYEVVPFHRELRRAELDDLAAWCEDETRAGVWLWTGEGGAGKTRLMIEWCRQLRAQGWHAGFLHRHLDGGIGRLVEGRAPRLVVVDYAETRQDVVQPLLYKVATATHGPRCRVVLLARREADWWRILREDDTDVEQLIATSPAPRQLPSLDAGRTEVFEEAAAAFSETADEEAEGDEPETDGVGFDRVLYVHMAAQAAVRSERIGDARDALGKTLDHERRYWFREAKRLDLDQSLTEHLREAVGPALAALTLVGGTTSEDETRSLVERVTDVSVPRGDLGKTLLRFLHRLYGGSEGVYRGLEPDILGEELVASCLADEAALLDRVLEVADDDGRSSLLTVLTRLARRRPEEERWLRQAFEGHVEELAEPALAVAVEFGDPVGRLLADFVSEVSGELAERLMDRCDAEDYRLSLPLREVAWKATYRCLEICRQSWPEPDEDQLRELSRAASNLGVRLSALGLREEALDATREAVDILRRLAASRPDAFLPDLAQSLNNLGSDLSDLGLREEALDATREAVDIRRRLAASRPDAFLPDLAQSLNSLGNMLSDLGLREQALDATREAIDIRRRLAASRPDAFLPDLAQSLNNLGKMLSDLGLREQALDATREAVDILRRLAASRPDAFLPDLARSLNNLGKMLSDLGLREQALDATREAVDILRRLAASRPDAFLPDLARSLNNLGNMLSDLGRREDAFEATEEAIRTLAPFFGRLPAAFAAWMRIMVGNYQRYASEAKRRVDDELLGPILEAVERLEKDD
jgi:tetratricopeptide (TPR) repeat protein